MGIIHKFFSAGMCWEHFRKNQIKNSEFSKFVNAFHRSNFSKNIEFGIFEFEFEILQSEPKASPQQLSERKI